MSASEYPKQRTTRTLRDIAAPKVRGAALWVAHAFMATCHIAASDRPSANDDPGSPSRMAVSICPSGSSVARAETGIVAIIISPRSVDRDSRIYVIRSAQEELDANCGRNGHQLRKSTMVVRSGNSALVWVAGNAPDVSTKGDYYQGKKSIPRPLQLIRHAGSGPLELTAHEALALTKMDWNNDALYDPVPVSIRYSQRLARTIANVPDLPRNVYPYRLFM